MLSSVFICMQLSCAWESLKLPWLPLRGIPAPDRRMVWNLGNQWDLWDVGKHVCNPQKIEQVKTGPMIHGIFHICPLFCGLVQNSTNLDLSENRAPKKNLMVFLNMFPVLKLLFASIPDSNNPNTISCCNCVSPLHPRFPYQEVSNKIGGDLDYITTMNIKGLPSLLLWAGTMEFEYISSYLIESPVKSLMYAILCIPG